MRLVVFGLGYSAGHYVRTRAASLSHVAAIVRGADKARRLMADAAWSHVPLHMLTFDDPAIAAFIAQADALLVSVPPGETRDPVLTAFGAMVAQAERLKAIVYLSTIGVYGDHGGAWIDETAPLVPTLARTRARVAAEEAWRAMRPGAHVLRLSGIYGPGRNAIVNLREGTARRIVKPGQVFNRIHVEDIARAIAAALVWRGDGDIWNVTDDEPAPPQDVVAYAAGLLGMPVPPPIDFATADLDLLLNDWNLHHLHISTCRRWPAVFMATTSGSPTATCARGWAWRWPTRRTARGWRRWPKARARRAGRRAALLASPARVCNGIGHALRFERRPAGHSRHGARFCARQFGAARAGVG